METDELIVGFLDLCFWKRIWKWMALGGFRLSIRFNLSVILVISTTIESVTSLHHN